jgi:hypothetical protein
MHHIMFIMKTTILLLLLSTAVSAVPDEHASIHRELRGKKADPVFESQYYTLKRDLRLCQPIVCEGDLLECPSPLCGGYIVQALNQKDTKCYDGKKSREGCYVDALDLSSTGLDQSLFWETIASSEGGVVLGKYKPPANPDLHGRLAVLAVEGGWVSFGEAARSVSRYCDCDPIPDIYVCDCGPGEVCVDDPSDRCQGCGCPTICHKSLPIDCSGGGECPPSLECIVEDPFCGSDDCKSTCVAYDVRGIKCGGVDEYSCLRGQTCIYRDCDPATAGADCEGVCVQKIGASCGGIYGVQCGHGLSCVDPLGDGCDNQCLGADCVQEEDCCGGICLPDLVVQLGGE